MHGIFITVPFLIGTKELVSECEVAKAQLDDNDTYPQVGRESLIMYEVITFLYFHLTQQLGYLERKWHHHEQNNFVMKECILLMLLCWVIVPGTKFSFG